MEQKNEKPIPPETISYANLQVSGFPFVKIRSFSLVHTIGEHARATIVGELEEAKAQDCLERTDEQTLVRITTTAKGQPGVLFCGCVSEVYLQKETDYAVLELSLSSTSQLLDIRKRKKVYQEITDTYETLFDSIFETQADVHVQCKDFAVGRIFMQEQETDWAFGKRLAARRGIPFSTNLSSKRPQLSLGMPVPSKTRTIAVHAQATTLHAKAYQKAQANEKMSMLQDFLEEEKKTYSYAYLGDFVRVGKETKQVKSVFAELSDGLLEVTLSLVEKPRDRSTPSSSETKQSNDGLIFYKLAVNPYDESYRPDPNPPKPPEDEGSNQEGENDLPPKLPIKGYTDTGGYEDPDKQLSSDNNSYKESSVQIAICKVEKVSGTKVEVCFSEQKGSTLIPYVTAYASSDGSGWYCMPEVGDYVYAFYPTPNQEGAFALGGVFPKAPADPSEKIWRAPGGKEIKFTKEGIYITCKENRVFLNLTQTGGIHIQSVQPIMVESQESVQISAAKEIHLDAKEHIRIGTPNAYLEMTEELLTLAAQRVIIN